MTTDQVRVRVTVTVTHGDGRQGRRSSVIELLVPVGDEKWPSLGSPRHFVEQETERVFNAAWREMAASHD